MTNTLTYVTPKLLAQGLLALRKACTMPRLVNTDYGTMFANKGNTVDVPIPSAITAVQVSAAATPPSTADFAPTVAQVTLNQWYEAPFYMTDQDIQTAMNGTIPMQASEAVKALAENVNAYIMGLYTKIYGYYGEATFGATNTVPFATANDTSAATRIRAVLNNQLAPLGDRRCVLNADAEANALNQRAFQDASWNASTMGITEGQIARKLGFDWFMDQQVPTHTAGTAENSTTNNAGYAIGIKTVTLASAGTGTFVVGDIIQFTGDTQTYVVTSGDADVSTGGSISFEPGLKVAIPASNTAITVAESHAVNLAFHRDAFAFASRPLADIQGMGSLITTAADPVSGLTLRLEVSREHKRTRFSYDILYGATLVRPELAARLAGA